MIQAAIVVIVAWGAFAFGAVYSWAYLPLLAACAAVGLLGLVWARGAPGSRANRATMIALLAVIAAGFVQLVPLPAPMLKAVSPATDAFLRHYDLGYAMDLPPHPLSINPRATMLGLGFLAVFVLFLAGLLRVFARSGVSRLVPAFVAVGAVLAIVAIAQKAVLGDHTYMGMKIYGVWTPESRLVVPFGPYINRNHFAGWMLMGIPLAIGYLFALLAKGPGHRYGWRTRLLWFSSPAGGAALLAAFAVVVMTLSLAMSMSRSAMACLTVAAVLVGWRLLRALRTPGARVAAGALFVLLIAAPALWLGVGATIERFSSDPVGSIDTRLRAWRDTRAVIGDFPLTGTGLNTFGTAMVLYQSGSRGVHFQESHNDYLQLAAEGGIVLGIPILVAVLLFLRTVRRRFRDRGDDPTTSWIRFGAVTGVLAVALQSLVEFSLQMPGNAAFFVVLLGIAMHRPPSALPPVAPPAVGTWHVAPRTPHVGRTLWRGWRIASAACSRNVLCSRYCEQGDKREHESRLSSCTRAGSRPRLARAPGGGFLARRVERRARETGRSPLGSESFRASPLWRQGGSLRRVQESQLPAESVFDPR